MHGGSGYYINQQKYIDTPLKNTLGKGRAIVFLEEGNKNLDEIKKEILGRLHKNRVEDLAISAPDTFRFINALEAGANDLIGR